MRCLSLILLTLGGSLLGAADVKDVQALLNREIVGPRQARLDVIEYLRTRIPVVKPAASSNEWKLEAGRLRAQVLDNVVFRGEAKKWRGFEVQIKWLDTVAGGPGYRIKKLRYEALPGLWIPALLYEPEQLKGKVPVMLAVNGHDGAGKAAPYKQERCINLAKRGMMALNVEWLGMGQLRGPGYGHGRMNQLDLCGTSGLSVFYLAMSRGLDVLLSLKNTDPTRVGVSGLSGGGWQTIFLSALDTRVTLSNPVAGYSSFLTRIEHFKDLGDSEQTPCDLAVFADYTHLTAMMAPRPTLLTFNAKDNCCFESGYALPPLEKAARPMFRLYDRETALRTHVNNDPGDHNFGKDNREALYRHIGAHWFPTSKDFDAREIDVKSEIKKSAELAVELPEANADFNSLAKGLLKDLPRNGALPATKGADWQRERRVRLAEVIRLGSPPYFTAISMPPEQRGGIEARVWTIHLNSLPKERGRLWSIPAVMLTPEKHTGTAVLIGDGGRKALSEHATRLLGQGKRVFVLDPFYNGESSIDQKAFLFALMVATVGDRALGIQAMQLLRASTASPLQNEKGVELVAVGPRASVTALVTAALDDKTFSAVTLHEPLGSLKEIVERNLSVEQMPELFCFGLLEQFDVKQLAALVAPRPLHVVKPSERANAELGDLKKWYKSLGKDFDPLAGR